MRLKMGSRRARDVSIGLDIDGGGLVPPELLLLLLLLPPPRLNESKSDAKEPTGEGESSSNLLLFVSGRLNCPEDAYEVFIPELENNGDTKSFEAPNKKADALFKPVVIGENGFPGNISSEKKVFIEVGDSLNDDGGDGESAVDPLLVAAGSVNLARWMLLLFLWLVVGGGGELLRASSAL